MRFMSAKMIKPSEYDYEVALAGSPNVGKSTIFNHLTGLSQHTGNWTGKTVVNAYGYHKHDNKTYRIVDLPGTYSLVSGSQEEVEALRYIKDTDGKTVVIVTGSLSLERNLGLAVQILAYTENAILCVNMMDEAKRYGIRIDTDELSLRLGIPVVACCSRDTSSLTELKNTIYRLCNGETKTFCVKSLEKEYIRNNIGTRECAERIDGICREILKYSVYRPANIRKNSCKADRILTSKLTGIPIMLVLYAFLFWITAQGANYPSAILAELFARLKGYAAELFGSIGLPEIAVSFLLDGVYATLSWVISVMLPPMAIFFPLFAILEDSGYLPRIAFNLDRCFAKAGASSKQSLTMAMGMGCNACGVMGCRIIENERERNIAVVTNGFIPCNGRLPSLIAVITVFFAKSSVPVVNSLITAGLMLCVFVVAVAVTLIVSGILSKTLFKGDPSGFVLELPPYRKPEILKTVYRSFVDKTIPVLGRAAAVAAPAGAVIWLLNHVTVNDISLTEYCVDFLDPAGILIGLDGVILLAFILGFPANETVIPVALMTYLSSSVMIDCASYDQLGGILTANGWSALTAVCFLIVCIFHYPCSTTCLTIYKETGSLKLTATAILLPTVTGVGLCMLISAIARLAHIFF